uniref:PiggyBac transposable element-derived protein domain-containing protein n=1 Tax=Clastoptera arizonana TaxID=38151 RepID=A0A1B6DW27_9HEMI
MCDVLTTSEIDHILQNSSEDDIDGFMTDCSGEQIEHNHISDDSELEVNDESDLEICDDAEFVLGKDGETIWCLSDILAPSKTRRTNIVKKIPGPKPRARNVNNEIDAFLSMISLEMIDEILNCTNKHIVSISHKFARERDCLQSNRPEIMALFGVLYLIGTRKSGHANVRELWAKDGTGIPIIRAAMNYKRFLFLLNCMRFDDKTTRDDRKKFDKLAPIRCVVDLFVKNCIDNYSTSEFVTIDEMLHRFRGRCSFVQYIPNKPAKYGLKMFALCDAKTFYCHNFEVYCGKQPQGPYETSNSAIDVVKRLVRPIENTNKNITTDNWYTSVPLADYLLSKRLTLIGTLKKNKAAIPPSFLPNKAKDVGTSMYGFQDDKTLVSYATKKTKVLYYCLQCTTQK